MATGLEVTIELRCGGRGVGGGIVGGGCVGDGGGGDSGGGVGLLIMLVTQLQGQ